jgi:hypothetical protein
MNPIKNRGRTHAATVWYVDPASLIAPVVQEEFEDTKGIIRRTDNTMAKRKRTNNDLQNIHIKLKIEQLV